MLSPSAFYLMSQERHMPPRVLRFFCWLLGAYDLRNWVVLRYEQVAKDYREDHPEGPPRKYVEKAKSCLHELAKIGILERGPLIASRWTWRLAPHYAMTRLECRVQSQALARREQRLRSLAVPDSGPESEEHENCISGTPPPAFR